MNVTLVDVEKVAQDEGVTTLEAVTMLQSAAAMTGNDEVLDQLCSIKSSLLGL